MEFTMIFAALLACSLLSADDVEERDRRWAVARATATAPASAILKPYWALCLGDGAQIQSCRSLFSDLTFNYRTGDGVTRGVHYLIFVPGSVPPGEKRPLVVWLHGRGDGEADELHHFITLSRLFFPPPWQRERYPFFLLSVMAPRDVGSWLERLPDSRDEWLDIVDMILAKTINEYAVDPDRISVVGASIGGTGCWELALRHPDRFCAIAPISSRGGDLSRVVRLKKVPTWTFQSTYDNLPVDRVRETVQLLQDAGGSAHLTEFPTSEHDAWTPAFDDYNLLWWLLRQQRGGSPIYAPGLICPVGDSEGTSEVSAHFVGGSISTVVWLVAACFLIWLALCVAAVVRRRIFRG